MEDTQTPQPEYPPIPPRRRSPWVIPLVILAVLVVACLALLAWAILAITKTDTFKGAIGQVEVMAKCQQQLQTIGAACRRYEISHDEYPPDLAALYPDYLESRSVLRCPADPRDPKSGPPSYYYKKPSSKAGPETIVCGCNQHRMIKDQPPMEILLKKNGQVTMTQPAYQPK